MSNEIAKISIESYSMFHETAISKKNKLKKCLERTENTVKIQKKNTAKKF